MINIEEVKSTSTSSGSGAYSTVYVIGDKAYMVTPLNYNEKLIRMKFEFWKEVGMLFSVDRGIKHGYYVSQKSVVLVVKRLISMYEPEVRDAYNRLKDEQDRFYGILDVISREYQDQRWNNMSEERAIEMKRAIYEELATNPELPSFNSAFIAYLNSGLKDFPIGFDTHNGNFMVDPDSGKIIPMDIINA